jgi:hypothetical protein
MTGRCVICDRPAERIADLGPGEPLFVCDRCLATWALEAHADELRRRGVDPALVDEYVKRIRASDMVWPR